MISGELSRYLNELLRVDEFQDYCSNGLEFDGRTEVKRVALAVDACAAVFREAVNLNSDIIIVHHGLFWGDIKTIRGNLKERLKLLFDSNISLYAAHLPLDAHPELGNNAQIMKLLKIKIKGGAGKYKGIPLGFWGELEHEEPLKKFTARVEDKLFTECRLLDFGGRVKKVAVLSGSGWQALYEAEETGFDTLITGEASHSAYTLAEELGVNIIFAGHYATERHGVKALGEHIKRKFGFDVKFIEHSTGI